jgi:hypothetical protein
MISNFVTPPDIIETILIIDALKEQVEACAETCRNSEKAYTVYFYQADMKDYNWLTRVVDRADVVLQHETSDVPILTSIKFGDTSPLKSPADYFAK